MGRDTEDSGKALISFPGDVARGQCRRAATIGVLLAATAMWPRGAQARQDMAHQHQMDGRGWRTMFDGVVFSTWNRQGGRRGETEVRSQNWMMAMASRESRRGSLTFTAMFSAEPATVGARGYSHLFQVGEAFRNLQVTDRQHPHDLFMQLGGSWRIPLGTGAGLTVAGALVGDAALGPVAFMHRPSSSENPSAPLSHHIFDSTHMSASVALAALDRGPWTIEASTFHGREPDEHRSDLDTGAPDSWSTRLWFRTDRWTIQASHGFLHEPEALEPGDQRRTSGSLSWFRRSDAGFAAITIAAGRTERPFSVVRAYLGEWTQQVRRTFLYARLEDLTVETEVLLFPQIVHVPHAGELVNRMRAATLGVVRDVATINTLRLGIGADVTTYGVPVLLQATHGRRPASFHVFARIRPAVAAGRMWNMTLGRPMPIHR
jgi:hypothetical protein